MPRFATLVVAILVACLGACGKDGQNRDGGTPPKVRMPAPQYSQEGGRVRYVRQGDSWFKWSLEGTASKWERVPDELVPAAVLEEHARRTGMPTAPAETTSEITLLAAVPEPKIPGRAGEILERLRTLDDEQFLILTEAAAAGGLSDAASERLEEIDREMSSFGCGPRKQIPIPPGLEPANWFSPRWLDQLRNHLLRQMRSRDPTTLTQDERDGVSWPKLEMSLFFVLMRQAAIEHIRRGEYQGTINPFQDPTVPGLWEEARMLLSMYARDTADRSAYMAFKTKVKELAPRVGLTEVDVDRRVREAWRAGR